MLVTEAIPDAKCLDIRVTGRESFKYTTYKKRDQESCRNYFIVLAFQETIAKFLNREIAPGQYSFKFKVQLPPQEGNVIPGSYMQRQDVNGEGQIKAKVAYKVSAVLYQWMGNNNIEEEKEIAKYTQRLFIA